MNLLNCIMFVAYNFYFYFRSQYHSIGHNLIPTDGCLSVYWAVSNTVLSFMSMIKVISYCNVSESFSKMTILLSRVFVELVPFNAVYFGFVVFSAFMFTVSGTYIIDEVEKFNFMSPVLITFIKTFRLSIGELDPPSFDTWKNSEGRVFMSYWISFEYIFAAYVQIIIMLNFLIA